MEPLLVFPDPPPALLVQTLDLAGYAWEAVSNAAVAAQTEPREGWSGAIIAADEDPEGAFALCRTLRLDAGRAAIAEWEREHGALTADELADGLARARALLVEGDTAQHAS